MPTLEKLKESQIQPYFTTSQWKKGVAMQAQVYLTTRSGDRLHAQVQGDQMYDVEIVVDDQGITATCGCEYGRLELCKHVCAVLVRYTRMPHLFKISDTPVKASGGRTALLEVRPAPEPAPRDQPPAWLSRNAQTVADEERATLHSQLEMITVGTLREIAAGRGWTLSGTLKAMIVEQMANYMADEQAVATTLEGIEKGDRLVLAAIAVVGNLYGYGTTKSIVDILTEFRKPATPRSLLRSFERLGRAPIVITGQLLGKDAVKDSAFVPRALWRHLPALLDPLIFGERDLPASAQPADIRESQPRRLVDAALQLLLAIEHWAPTRAPRTPRPLLEDTVTWLRDWEYDLDELTRLFADSLRRSPEVRLSVPPPPRSLVATDLERFQDLLGSPASADFLFRLLEGAGLIRPGNPVRVDEQAKRAFLQRSPAEQLAILFDVYVDLLDWQETWEVLRAGAPRIKMMRIGVEYRYSPSGTEAMARQQMTRLRQTILQVLAWLPEENWISVEEVCRLLFRIVPTFDQHWPHGAMTGYTHRPGWYFAWEGRALGASPDDWGRVVGNVLGNLLIGPLFWFGVVDVQVTNNTISHIRLHGLAHLFRHASPAINLDRAPARRAAPTPAPVAPPVVVGDKIKLQTLAGNAALILERIAQPVTVQLNNVVYRLDVARVHATFESGATVDSLADEWEACFGTALPPALHAHLSGWWEQYGRVRLYQNLTLIEFADDYALTEMRAVTALDDVLLVQISPRAVLIPATAVDDLVAKLQKAGYTPKLSDGTES